MRHQHNDEQEPECDGRQQKALNMPERRRCQECGEPPLQRPHSTQERRLETRTTAPRLGDLEQQLSVRGRIAEAATTRLSQSISTARHSRRSCHHMARFHGIRIIGSDATKRRRASCARRCSSS